MNDKRIILSEKDIIYKYLRKLNFHKEETFDFQNDGAFLKNRKNKEIVVTNDTILESVDFFKLDDPESIAQKIVTYNLSDLSSMGVDPHSYTLSLCLTKNLNSEWLIRFTKKLLYLQKKYNFFLLGGDISKSSQLIISSNFYGYIKKKNIIKRQFARVGDTIWVTGNIGDSYIGLLIKKKKLHINKRFQKYFLNKYHYPEPCMIGSKINNIASSAIDISDGFYGDLSKLLCKNNLGADIEFSKFPFSKQTNSLLKSKLINSFSLLNGGDDYELIFTSSNKHDVKIANLVKKYKFKLSKIGRIINKEGIYLDKKKLLNSKKSFQYFF